MAVEVRKAVCPNNPDHDTFIASAVVAELWVVDGRGEFLGEYRGSKVTMEKPSMENTWACKTCGAEAVFK